MTARHAQSDRPEPVLDAVTATAKISAAVKAVLALVTLISVGVSLDDVDALVQAGVLAIGTVGAVVVLAVDYLGALRRGRAVRDVVTPVDDPVDDQGEPLQTTEQLRDHGSAAYEQGKAAGIAAAAPTEADLEAARAAIASLREQT